VPLPETVRDAVAIGAAELSEAARAAAEVAAVAGERFEPELVARFSSDVGLSELLGARRRPGGRDRRGAVPACAGPRGDVREVPWLRRRTLHRELAEALEAAGAARQEVATHWLAAREPERAREALLQAAAASEAVHAYRDAAQAGRRALERWPETGDEDGRGEALQRYGRCCELAGELAEAARAWRELAAIHGSLGHERSMADAQRRLAAVAELRGDREAAFAARRIAADAYERQGCAAEAAVERLAMANQLRVAARHGEAMELADQARLQAERAERVDLRARAVGLEGLARAKHGDYERGLETVRSALTLALQHDLTAVAAELYQRLSVVLYDAADYPGAEEALDAALELCRTTPDAGTELACVTCMAYVLRERGDWARAAELCRDLIAQRSAVFVAEGLARRHPRLRGQGQLRTAAALLVAGRRRAGPPLQHVGGHDVRPGPRRRGRGRRRRGSRPLSRALGPLGRQRRQPLRGSPACAGRPPTSPGAVTWATPTPAPTCSAASPRTPVTPTRSPRWRRPSPRRRCGRATRTWPRSSSAGPWRSTARWTCRSSARRSSCAPASRWPRPASGSSRSNGCRTPTAAPAGWAPGPWPPRPRARSPPWASRSSRAWAGAPAPTPTGAALSRREREVVRLLALGRTNREIAHELFLSPRTVDMHVRNILRKLDSRSRMEAAHRARELGLVA
jgi:DNA-binding CsgD family transcriptional regulator/tetratricopeptide (TPR) repeat protein